MSEFTRRAEEMRERIMRSKEENFSEWFVEFVAGNPKYNRKTPPHMVKLKELGKERQKYGDIEAYTSIFRYPLPDPYCGPLLSGLCLDFDDVESGGEKARKDAIIVLNEIMRRYRVPEESFGIAYSGGKGFHVIVNRRVFNIEPSGYLPQVWKSMAEELKQQCRLKTLDTDIYDCRRLWRLPNSRHPSGYYKIHITKSELENLSMEQIRDLATKPRTTLAIEPKYSAEADTWYKQHLNKATQWMAERKERFEALDLATLPAELPCVQKLFKEGVAEGKRNDSRYRLIVHLKTAGKSLEECKQLILDFNNRCVPPESQDKVLDQLEYLHQHEYHVGCGNFIDYCPGKEHCPLFAKKTAKDFPEDIRREALKRLESPDLEQWSESVYDKLIVRERENKLLCHYLELSGRRKNPSEKQLILLMGDPGGGKTTLANETTRVHRTKKRGRLSERALDYGDLSNYDILYLQEILGVEKEEHGISTLRFLSAEDKGYTVEVVIRDPQTGRFTTEEYMIPPICVVSTLTSVAVERQLERRSWLLNVDESEEQTRLILEHKAQKIKERFEELMGLREPDREPMILECTINMLEDGEVIVPYPKALTKAIDTTMLRSRGDYDKIYTLIQLRAWYHQRQRQCLTTPDGRKVWIATPEDGIKSLELASKAMRRWRTQLDERLLEAIPHMKKLIHETVLIGKDEEDVVCGITADRLAKKMRISDQTARKYLNAMTEQGVLTYTEPKGRLKVYEFVVPEEEIEKKLEVTSLQLNEVTLASEFEKEAEKFLEAQYFKRNVEVESIKIEESATPTSTVSIVNITEKPDLAAKEEKKPETTSIQMKAEFDLVQQIKPSEPCGQCGKYLVEYIVTLREDGTVLRRCPACFEELKPLLKLEVSEIV